MLSRLALIGAGALVLSLSLVSAPAWAGSRIAAVAGGIPVTTPLERVTYYRGYGRYYGYRGYRRYGYKRYRRRGYYGYRRYYRPYYRRYYSYRRYYRPYYRYRRYY